jgi:aspartyl-tRNA(Asn)/glutamyl-tRNA(Gln) amidotransferase subunit A
VTVDDATLVATIAELGEGLRAGEYTVRELTEASLDRLERVGPELNAVVTVTRERALAAADGLDAELAAGEPRGPLHGVPFGVKDLLAVEGHPTSWGAAPLADREREGTATVVERLEAAGGVLVGKLAMVELAGGLGYEQADASFTGPGLTPWDPDAWSGGSSSGAGSAVPTGLVGFAIGSETWGSIVGPATYCGVVGLRPTYGRVSRAGAMALSWTMDKLGPLCRSVDGCATVLEAIAGPDPADDTATDRPLAGGAGSPPRVAVLADAAADAQPGVRENYEASLATLRAFATVETVELPDYPYAAAARTVISAEAAAAFDDLVDSGATEELTAPADRIGAYANGAVLAKDYLHAMRIRERAGRELDALLEGYDALVTPSASTVAIPVDTPFEEYREPYELPPVGAAANLAGLPAVAVPNGLGERGCPTGLTVTGRAYDDLAVLDVAREFAARTDGLDYAGLLDRFR